MQDKESLAVMEEGISSLSAADLLKYALLTFALSYAVVYLILAYFRIGYPFELEWMEGGMLEHVRRVLEGEKLYVAPSLDFVSFVYPPLYYYLSAGLAKVLGLGFTPLRLISFLASLGSGFFIYLMVRRETGRNLPAVLASCLFAAIFGLSKFWFDLARVDSLFLFLLLPALYLLRFKVSPASYFVAGIFVGLSFLTKQSAFTISLPLMLYSVFADRRAAVAFIAAAGGIMILSVLILNQLFDGWYYYYVFEIITKPSLSMTRLLRFWTHDMLLPLSVACAGFVAFFSGILRNRDWKAAAFYMAMAAGMVGSSWLARMHTEAWQNVIFPGYAALAIFFGLGVNTALRPTATSSGWGAWGRVFIYSLCIVQFACLTYNPLHQIPTAKDLEAGQKLLALIKQVKGEILIPYHGYLAARAGKRSYAHAIAISDFLRCTDEAGEQAMVYQAWQALDQGKFDMVIMDSDPYLMAWFNNLLNEYYVPQGQIFKDDSFWPKTGMKTRPTTIYVLKNGVQGQINFGF